MRVNRYLFSIPVLVCLISCLPIRAEDPAPQPQQQRRQWDPAAFRQRILDRIKETLAPSDDEWKVLQPKVEAVQELQMDAMAGRAGMFRRGGGGGGAGGGGAGGTPADTQPKTDLQTKMAELQALLDKTDADPKAIKDKLKDVRDAKDKAKADLKKAQDDLKELLNQKQEAQLVMMGLLD